MPKRVTLGGIGIDETEPLSIINLPIDWKASWNLAKQARSIRFLQDDKGNIIAFPMIKLDPNSSSGSVKAMSPTIGWIVPNTTADAVLHTAHDPGANKYFRLKGGIINVPLGATCAGTCTITINDGALIILNFYLWTGALAALTVPFVLAFSFPDNGYLSTTQGNKVGYQASAAMTAGVIEVNLWGNDE